MKCPNCGAENPQAQEECGGCGLIFAKWQKRAEAQAAGAAESPARQDENPGEGGGARSWLIGALLLVSAFTAALYTLPAGKDGKPAGPARLSPEPYRAEITALEEALYKEEPANFQDGQAVERAAAAIVNRLAASKKLMRGGRLESLTALAGLAGGEGLTFPANARRDWITMWERARSEIFEEADWFHAPLFFDPVVAAAADPAKLTIDLQRALAQTDALIAAARLETRTFVRRDVNLSNLKSDPENEPELERWRNWVEQWRGRVGSVAGLMPDPKLLPGKELQEAHRALDQVLGLLSAPANPGPGVFLGAGDPALNAVYLPGERSREEWLNTAENWLKYPRSLLAPEPQGAAGG